VIYADIQVSQGWHASGTAVFVGQVTIVLPGAKAQIVKHPQCGDLPTASPMPPPLQ
jgi:hypothetical protein